MRLDRLLPGLLLLALLSGALRGAQQAPVRPWVGLTEPSRKAVLAFVQDGRITELLAAEGERVSAGQILARLDATVQQLELRRLEILCDGDADLRRAELELELAQREEARAAELLAQEIKSSAELEARRLATAIARARLELARQEQRAREVQRELARELLEQRWLRSPFDGVVTQHLLRAGESAERLTPVLEVQRTDPLRVEFACPVAELAQCRPGTQLIVHPGHGVAPRHGLVAMVGPQIEPASQTVRVRLELPNTEQPWPSGLRVEVEPLPQADPAPAPAGR